MAPTPAPITPALAVEAFLAQREEWVSAGRPTDPSFAYWRTVLERQAEPSPAFVEPLVVLG